MVREEFMLPRYHMGINTTCVSEHILHKNKQKELKQLITWLSCPPDPLGHQAPPNKECAAADKAA
jgi:hypothetical protein